MRFDRHARGRGWTVLALTLLIALASTTVALAQDQAVTEPAAKSSDSPLAFLGHFFNSLGWVFGPLLGVVSVCLFAFVVLLILDLRMSVIVPPGFVEEFTDTVNKRQFKQAFDLARNDTARMQVRGLLALAPPFFIHGCGSAACFNRLVFSYGAAAIAPSITLAPPPPER